MGSTNKTANLELSQFIATDSPKWLTDYNADMEKIDVAVSGIKTQADATDLAVNGLTSTVTTLGESVSDQSTAISNLRTDVTTNTGSINTINSLIGNGTPTTTDQTIIGAINEINAKVTNNAEDIDYDNTSSGLSATNVQAAIDELADIGDHTLLAQSASTTIASTVVSLAPYRTIEVIYSNDSGKVYLAQSIPKSLFVTLDSANKSFAPEVYTAERNSGEFYYNSGTLYYRKAQGSLNVAIYGIK